jgi:uncharacterized RDD family membrane protein YckC
MLDNTNSPQQSMIQGDTIEETGQEINSEPIFTLPPIAGFWRRFFAWLVDTLILGVMGQIIAITFSSFFFSIGPYGRPIGLLFIIPYFGMMNSKIGGGQTPGKRWMKVAVRNRNNESIEVWRSIIRISLLALPALFNGWAVPIFQNYVLAWFLSIFVFGLGGAIFYTMVFNRKARQGIHDLVLGTYVVHLPEKPIESFPVTSRIHWIIVSIWIGIVTIGSLAMVFVAPSIISKTPFASAKNLYDILQDDPRFFTVGVKDQTFYGSNGKTSRSLNITVWQKGKVSENAREEMVNGIVKTVLDHGKNITDYDGIRINITSAYDIGIASGQRSFWVTNSIEGWRREIYPNGSPSGFIPFLMAKALAIP